MPTRAIDGVSGPPSREAVFLSVRSSVRHVSNGTLIFLLLILTLQSTVASDNKAQPRNVEFDDLQQIPLRLDDVDDDFPRTDMDQGTEPDGSGEWVIAPLPSLDPLLGWTVALPVMYLYRPSNASERDRPWITGAMGLYTEDGGWGAGAFHRMSLGGDRWRVSMSAFSADFDYRFFGIGGDGTSGFSVPINQTLSGLYTQALRRMTSDLFVGLQITRSRSTAAITIDGVLPPELDLPDLSREIDLAALTPKVQFDSRDDEFFPTSGVLGEASVAIQSDWLGSDRPYEKYELEFNAYRSVSEYSIVASRVVVKYLEGDAPFFAFPAFGAGADLRGYDTGIYRDRFMFATQTEYRHNLGRRFRTAVFGGIGTTSSSFASWDESLWSIGAGLRWVVAPENDIAIRFDIARGRDDTQFYIGLGEAF